MSCGTAINPHRPGVAAGAPGKHNRWRGGVVVEVLVIVAGLIAGSFLNVCIARIPEGQSVVLPPSHCPRCKAPIHWYDNIPLISYLVLGGRCRSCRGKISIRYPLVESTTAVLAWVLYVQGFEPRVLLLYTAITGALIVVTFIDIDHRIIPDMITIPSILIAPAVAFVLRNISVLDSLLGIVVGGGILWLIAEGYWLLRKQEGMGLGDVKLLAMVGGFFGWQGAMFTLLVGSVVGSFVGLAVMVARRGRLDMEIPFGPFLAAGAILYMLYGPRLIQWYLDLPLLLS